MKAANKIPLSTFKLVELFVVKLILMVVVAVVVVAVVVVVVVVVVLDFLSTTSLCESQTTLIP